MAKMRKADLIKVLVDNYGYSEEVIKRKKNVELELLIKKEKAKMELEEPKKDEQSIKQEQEIEVKAEGEIGVTHEHTQQLWSFSDYIYHVKNKGAKVIVQNQGMGDIYASKEGFAVIGEKKQRIPFRSLKEFEDVEILYFVSATQPVITIIEEVNTLSC